MKGLLHICCGPCSIYPALKLKGLKIDFDAYFYNPNINNKEELIKRLENALKVAKRYKFKVLKNLNQDVILEDNIKNNKNTRCEYCYNARFDEVFNYAKNKGYDFVMTSLLGSPYQNHKLLIEKLEDCKNKFNLEYKEINFQEGFYYGQKLARKNDIYCQKYCGCAISYENYLKKIKKELEDND